MCIRIRIRISGCLAVTLIVHVRLFVCLSVKRLQNDN